jgi:hypothetical protein
MTKQEFTELFDRERTLGEIADDTSLPYKERDLARILQLSTLLLVRKDFNSAKRILEIYVEEVGRI